MLCNESSNLLLMVDTNTGETIAGVLSLDAGHWKPFLHLLLC